MLRRSVQRLAARSAAIDWSALSAHVPGEQRSSYAQFKQKYDSYKADMEKTPSVPQALDLSRYRAALGRHAAIVDDVEKIYKVMDVTARPPLAEQLKKIEADPKVSAEDKKQFADIVTNFNSYTTELESMKKDEVARAEVFLAELTKETAELKATLERIQNRKDIAEMTLTEMEAEFPEYAAEVQEEIKNKEWDKAI